MKWQKAIASDSGNCVELARSEDTDLHIGDGQIAMRNSRFPDGAVLVFTKTEIAAFLNGAKAGEFDHFAN